MFQKKLEQYARLLIKVGLNVQPGQTVVIRSPVECAELVRMCAAEAYGCGCREVVVDWRDDALERQKYLLAEDEVFDEYSQRDRLVYELGFSDGAVMLDFYVSDPDLMSGVDPQRIIRARKARMSQIGPLYQRIFDKTAVQCTAAPPIGAWARKAFPDVKTEEALALLWDKVFSSMRIDGTGDTAKLWERHFETMRRQACVLNVLEFRTLHYRNSLGTDLEIEMPSEFAWQTCLTETEKGQQYVLNLPTEEIYAAPKRDGVNGIVYGSMPLVYQGCVIRDFWLRFEHGKVVQAEAGEGADILRNLLDYDQGSSYLGEVALVPCDSAVGNAGTLFYHPLYDENASCHLALGLGIVECIPGSEKMTQEQLSACGINYSGIHVDFMIGTQDLSITGRTRSGESVDIFTNGKFTPGLL